MMSQEFYFEVAAPLFALCLGAGVVTFLVRPWWISASGQARIVALATAGALLILGPLIVGAQKDEWIRTHRSEEFIDLPSYPDRDNPFDFKFRAASTVAEFMHPGDSQILFVGFYGPIFPRVREHAPPVAEDKEGRWVAQRHLTCNLYAPGFEPSIALSNNSCLRLITPRQGHEGSQVLVYTVLTNGKPIGFGYRTVNVGAYPFSIVNLSTTIGVLSALAALVFQLSGRSREAGSDEKRAGEIAAVPSGAAPTADGNPD
jgi:hypothetical protein